MRMRKPERVARVPCLDDARAERNASLHLHRHYRGPNASRPSFLARGFGGSACWVHRVRRVAFAYHGEYMRRGSDRAGPRVCTDFFAAYANHRDMLFQPLLDAGVRVQVFFHAFASSCPSAAASVSQLVTLLRPDAFEVEPVGLVNHVDKTYTFVKVLRLVLASWDQEAHASSMRMRGAAAASWSSAATPRSHRADADAELVVLCRFETEYLVPIVAWNVDPTNLNLAFRDMALYTNLLGKASDLLFLAPRRDGRALLTALSESTDNKDTLNHRTAGMMAGHLVWRHFAALTNRQPHFIDGMRQGTSNLGVTPYYETFLGLRRECRRYSATCFGNTAAAAVRESRRSPGNQRRKDDWGGTTTTLGIATATFVPPVVAAGAWADSLNDDMLEMMRTRPPAPPHIPPFRPPRDVTYSEHVMIGTAKVVGAAYVFGCAIMLRRYWRSRGSGER